MLNSPVDLIDPFGLDSDQIKVPWTVKAKGFAKDAWKCASKIGAGVAAIFTAKKILKDYEKISDGLAAKMDSFSPDNPAGATVDDVEKANEKTTDNLRIVATAAGDLIENAVRTGPGGSTVSAIENAPTIWNTVKDWIFGKPSPVPMGSGNPAYRNSEGKVWMGGPGKTPPPGYTPIP